MANNAQLQRTLENVAAEYGMIPIGGHYQQTITTLFTIDPAIINDDAKEDTINCVQFMALTQGARYTISGTNPTTTLGFYTSNEIVTVPLTHGTTVKIISAAPGGVLEYQFGRI